MHLSKEQLLSHCFQTSLSGIPTPPKATAIIAVVMSDRSIDIINAIFLIADPSMHPEHFLNQEISESFLIVDF